MTIRFIYRRTIAYQKHAEDTVLTAKIKKHNLYVS